MCWIEAPQLIRGTVPHFSKLAKCAGAVSYEDGRAIIAEAEECKRLVDLFPNALKHRTKIGVFDIDTKPRHGDSKIECIVTTAEARDLRPRDLRSVFE